MSINANYLINSVGTGNNVAAYSAYAVEQVLKKSWTFQWTRATPLLSMIYDRKTKWNKGFTVKGTRALIPVLGQNIENPQTAGVLDANEIPNAWPTYDVTQGFTQAGYEYAHYRKAMTIKNSERMLTADGSRGSLIEGKTKQLMADFRKLLANDVAGTNDASRTHVLGLDYALRTTGSLGGIDRATYTWWQPGEGSGVVTGVGSITLPQINNLYDTLSVLSDESGETAAPDLLLLSSNPGAVNVYGRVRELIAPAERIVNAEFKAKYGFVNFMYLDMICALENRIPAGSAYMLNTSTFYYGGYEEPKQETPIRIPNSDAYEYMYNMWCFMGCDEPRRNGKMSGITG